MRRLALILALVFAATAAFATQGIVNPLGVTSEYFLAVAQGEVDGVSFNRKFGSIDAIQSATPADVWEYGVTPGAERYTFSADGVADIDSLSSSSVADVEPITIEGLDIDGEAVTQTITLNGQVTVPLTTPLWRVNRAYNADGNPLVGNVYIFVNGATVGGIPSTVTDVRAFISPGHGQTLQAVYTVPAGKTAYFVGIESSLTKGVGATVITANLQGSTREFGHQFRVQDEFNLISSGTSNKTYNFPVPLPFAEKTDFCPLAGVSANGVGVSWAFTVVLVDN